MTDQQKLRLSNLSIWLGVLAWVPFVGFRLFGYEVSLVPFLILHLVGVSGGLILRKLAAPDPGEAPRNRVILRRVSTVLLVLGVSVWGVYFGLKWGTGVEREVTPFLIAHLSGVLTGAGIKIYTFMSR